MHVCVFIYNTFTDFTHTVYYVKTKTFILDAINRD